jgi:hypothetical protein
VTGEASACIDASGRRLTLRTLSARERFELFKAIPNEQQANLSWMGWTLAACSVRAINDVPVPMPTSEKEIAALVSQLDDDGIEVAQQFIIDRQKERAGRAKNLPGIPASESVSGS